MGRREKVGWGVAVAALLALSSAPFLPPFADDPLGILAESVICLLTGLSLFRPVVASAGMLAVSVVLVLAPPDALGLSVLGFGVATAALLASGRKVMGASLAAVTYTVLVGLGLSQATDVSEGLEVVGFWTIGLMLSVGGGVAIRAAHMAHRRQTEAHSNALAAEREEMARHLHNTIVRATDQAVWRAEAAQRRRDASDQTLRDLEFIAECCRSAVAEERRLLSALYDGRSASSLRGDVPQPVAVIEAAAAWLRRKGFEVSVRIEGRLVASDDTVARAFADAVREVSANVAAHADRTQPIVVSATSDDEHLSCEVCNGVDPSPTGAADGHIGLGLVSRDIHRVGGACYVQRRPGKWVTELRMPVLRKRK